MSTEPQSSPVPGAQPQSGPDLGPPEPRAVPQHTVKRNRISRLWLMVASFGVVLLLLLIFILQNSRTVDVTYLGAHGHFPLGVALLLAAVSGVLLALLASATRIIQLRAGARRNRRADARQR